MLQPLFPLTGLLVQPIAVGTGQVGQLFRVMTKPENVTRADGQDDIRVGVTNIAARWLLAAAVAVINLAGEVEFHTGAVRLAGWFAGRRRHSIAFLS